ncbi:MAG: hypothetical protein SGARI_006158 [Bacillariaceae sp.]
MGPWIAVVRDPIDHFLSAWAEIRFRKYQLRKIRKREKFRHPETEEWMSGDYDLRVRAFLHEVRQTIWPVKKRTEKTHANPQANFLMDENGEIYDNVQVVGDLSEMKTVLTKVGNFRQWTDNSTGRDSSLNEVKQQYFPRRPDLLSKLTLTALCEFHEIDYFLFDFDPPIVCTEKGGPFASWWGKV